jgi:hypothetical protein
VICQPAPDDEISSLVDDIDQQLEAIRGLPALPARAGDDRLLTGLVGERPVRLASAGPPPDLVHQVSAGFVDPWSGVGQSRVMTMITISASMTARMALPPVVIAGQDR